MINVGVIGATGYAGAELMRLLHMHPEVNNIHASSVSYKGEPFSHIYQNFYTIDDALCVDVDISKLSKECDIIFLSLPHGLASKMVTKEILANCIVVDLGADYRLKDINTYTSWYNTEHHSKELIPSAVYGLSELYRKENTTDTTCCKPGLLYYMLNTLPCSISKRSSH